MHDPRFALNRPLGVTDFQILSGDELLFKQHLPSYEESKPPTKTDLQIQEWERDLVRMQTESLRNTVKIYSINDPCLYPKEKKPSLPPAKESPRTKEFKKESKLKWWFHGACALLLAICTDVLVTMSKDYLKQKQAAIVTAPAQNPEAEIEIPITNYTVNGTNMYMRSIYFTNTTFVTNMAAGTITFK